MAALKALKKIGKKKPPPPKPVQIATEEEYEVADPESIYDDGEAHSSDEDAGLDIYEDPDKPKSPEPNQRSRKAPPPTSDDNEESLYAVTNEAEDDVPETNGSVSSAPPIPTSPKPPLPPPPRAGKEDKKLNVNKKGHGFSQDIITQARGKLKNAPAVQNQKSEEEHEPLSPKNLTPSREKRDKKSNSTSSEPESPHRPLPLPPPPPDPTEDIHTPDAIVDVGSDSPPTPPLPKKDILKYDDEDIYSDAVSDPLSKFDWFHGDITREEGSKRVQAVGKDGTFLVRKSAKHDNQPYTMVLLYQERVNNLKIRVRNDEKYALGEEKANEIHFEDVPNMVDYHKRNAVTLTGNQKGETILKDSPSLKST